MMRWLLLTHRWLGIGIGWLVLAWCLSGFVMMYVAYPEMSLAQRLRGLEPLVLERCCARPLPDAHGVAGDFHLEMLASAPVLRLGGTTTFDLRRGAPITTVSADEATGIARDFIHRAGLGGELRYLGAPARDQWTVYGGYNRHRPLHHFAVGDDAGTELYVSSATGEVVQETDRAQRFWNWLGAVPHWLYLTILRQDTAAWVQVIIWTSVISLFLVALGVYVGIVQLWRKPGRWSPYRGFALWHHGAGLLFGLLALTWLGSGLLSVNPWGMLQGESASAEARRVQASEMSWDALNGMLERLATAELPPDTVRIEAAPFAGRMYLLAYDRRGAIERLEAASLRPAPLDSKAIENAAALLEPTAAIESIVLLTTDDAYYFDHHLSRPFPVWRVTLADDEQTRYYLDAVSGRIVEKVDAEARWHRWLFAGLHRLDFTRALRQRPVWDVLVLTLLAGVTVACFTGTYMGVRHLAGARARRRTARTPLTGRTTAFMRGEETS